jgi:hypothetical protein
MDDEATATPPTGWRGARNQQTARAGEHFVAAELNRRGAYAVTFAGNMPGIDLLASDRGRTRTVSIQVKTRRSGSWHSSIGEGRASTGVDDDDSRFWVFVDLGDAYAPPRYYIVRDAWIRHDIYEAHQAYIAKHGGQRAKNPTSLHHAIYLARIEQWEDRWDLLNLF